MSNSRRSGPYVSRGANGSEDGRCDVLIAGAGPAGAIAARQLALAGLSVVVADNLAVRPPKIGETLPGAAIRLLNALGLGSITTEQPPLRCAVGGIFISWNDATIVANDGCNDPYGRGLRLDRAPFDAALREAAVAAGACLMQTQVTSLARWTDEWGVGLADGRMVHTRWLIDATGRRARLARLMAQRRWRGAPLVALYRTGQPETSKDLNRTLIAAGPEGWIYAGHCGDGRWIFGYHTLPGQAARLHARPECWNDVIVGASGLRDLLGRIALDPGVHAHDARTAWLDPPAGAGWVAVGDAALTFDPIAGQGLFNAIYTAMSAAKMIQSATSHTVLSGYTAEMAKAVAIYAARRRALYGQECRWCDRPFWQVHQDRRAIV
jgi:flavin-dependent dehydrogenase